MWNGTGIHHVSVQDVWFGIRLVTTYELNNYSLNWLIPSDYNPTQKVSVVDYCLNQVNPAYPILHSSICVAHTNTGRALSQIVCLEALWPPIVSFFYLLIIFELFATGKILIQKILKSCNDTGLNLP